jgi:hypothetical protein
MFNECRHILTSGSKCKAAALRGQAFCYFHTIARRYANGPNTSFDSLKMPSIEDTAGVQVAINQVLRGLGTRSIDRRQAGIFFYGLQIAARLARKSEQKLTETVREVCEEPIDGTLAPEKTTCEPPADCINCRRQGFCEQFEDWEGDVEELEERLEAEREANEEEEEESENEEEESDDEVEDDEAAAEEEDD